MLSCLNTAKPGHRTSALRGFVLLALCLGFVRDCFPATLPQKHSWQVTFRNHLKSFETDEFVIENHTFEFPRDFPTADIEHVYRSWIILGHLGREPNRWAIFAEPEEFTLPRIEANQIRSYLGPAGLAWWAQFDFGGNPYHRSEGLLKRAIVIALVDMCMLETAQENPRNIKADFMGANLGTWAYTFDRAQHLLPTSLQQAYKEAMLHYLLKMERLAPRDQNTNMDMREIVTLAELDQVFGNDPAMHERLVNDARRILFGGSHRGPATSDPRRGTFHPAGYIGEADGPETSYNGISLYHLTEAAMITRGDADWDAFLPEVIERMVRFKALNYFPEPDGSYDGPSSWAKRTNDPYSHDQRDRAWRPFAEAMLTDDALFRLRVDPQSYDGRAFGFATRQNMLADIQKGIVRLNRPIKLTRQQQAAGRPPVWIEDHWPADIPYTWDHYRPGSYARFQKAINEKDELLVPPFAREDDLNVNLDGEFWMVKRDEWGFQVEAVPHMGRDYDIGGSGALAGGSLAAFWTRPTGSVVLGRLPAKWNYVTWDKIDQWPTHHLWGRTADGSAFSSARQRNPRVSFETSADPPQVHVFGGLGSKRTVEKPDILTAGYVYYRRTFTLANEGLRIRSEQLSNEDDVITQLWETLPIFAAGESEVEYLVDRRWKPATSELTPNVDAVRLQRHRGAVIIEFDEPQRVQLGPVFTTEYQKKDQLRTLNIDLLGSNSRPVTMRRKTVVSYLIHEGSAGVGTLWISRPPVP